MLYWAVDSCWPDLVSPRPVRLKRPVAHGLAASRRLDMNLPLLAVTSGPLDPGKLTHAVAVEHARRAASEVRPGPGAVDTFVGVVRGHNLGRVVEHLEYEAFEPLALKAFSRIVDEIDERWAGCVVGIHHRTGRLEVGETSVVIAAASAHRGDAFAASRYAIERLKQIAPIDRKSVV